jgi:hypothetical protein
MLRLPATQKRPSGYLLLEFRSDETRKMKRRETDVCLGKSLRLAFDKSRESLRLEHPHGCSGTDLLHVPTRIYHDPKPGGAFAGARRASAVASSRDQEDAAALRVGGISHIAR